MLTASAAMLLLALLEQAVKGLCEYRMANHEFRVEPWLIVIQRIQVLVDLVCSVRKDQVRQVLPDGLDPLQRHLDLLIEADSQQDALTY